MQPLVLLSFGRKLSTRFLVLSRLLYNERLLLLQLLLLYFTKQRKNFILGAIRTVSRWL